MAYKNQKLKEKIMKKTIIAKSDIEMKRKYPINDLLDQWFFKCCEVSNGHYIAEGSDRYGRTVSCEGTDYEDVLKEIVLQASNFDI